MVGGLEHLVVVGHDDHRALHYSLYEEGPGVKGVAHVRACRVGWWSCSEWVGGVRHLSRVFETGVLRQSGRQWRAMNGAEMVDQYGVVLQSARGAVVNLPELVVGGPVSGSWWAHPRHDEIFRVLNEAAASEDVVRLPLVKGKLALVHRRLWPALVRLVDRIGPDVRSPRCRRSTRRAAPTGRSRLPSRNGFRKRCSIRLPSSAKTKRSINSRTGSSPIERTPGCRSSA